MLDRLPLPKPRDLRAAGVVLICLAVAVVANVAIISLARATDERRQDQIHIANLQFACHRLLPLLQGGTRGEDVRAYEGAVVSVDATLAKIGGEGLKAELAAFEEAYADFRDKADRQVDMILSGQLDRARRFDRITTNPSFAPVQRAIEDLDMRCREQTRKWTRLTELLTSACLLAAAVVVGVLFFRHQRKTVALLQLEAGQQSALAGERRFRALVRNNADVIAVLNDEGDFRLVSGACERKWKVSPESLLGQPLSRYVHPSDTNRLLRLFEDITQVPRIEAKTEARMRSGSEEYRSFDVYISNLLHDPDVAGVLLTFHDLTERKRLEEELIHYAFHDRLTGLPNRALFLNRLAHRLEAGDPAACAVLFIDLDNFKIVNDSLGHAAGDLLLTEVGLRLRSALRPSDTVARLGGDEFTVVLDGVSSEAEAVAAANRILDVLTKPIVVSDRGITISASIGIALSSEEATDAHELLRDADTAMYEAKAIGKAGYAVFDRRMNDAAKERLDLESELRTAVEKGQLALCYQPIVDLESGRLQGVEALVRWRHPVLGDVPPAKFIPIAEETGLICAIGEWVLEQACSQIVKWQAAIPSRSLELSVNVAGRQFHQPTFIEMVAAILKDYGIAPNQLKLEVTETTMLRDLETIRVVFQRLREIGVRIAIDDFGTGYSSMSYLSRLPIDTLKIDRSFVHLLGNDSRTNCVVQAMVAMARSLALQVTIEGIETVDQLALLRRLGCDTAQGFLFSEPLNADEIEGLLRSTDLVLGASR